MEITSFVLGMLAIVTVAMVAVIVVGIVKILKLTNHVDEFRRQHMQEVDSIYRHISLNQQGLWRQFETTGRDVTEVEKTIMAHVDAKQRELEQSCIDLRQMVEHESAHGHRYTDHRIDKLIDTYFGMMKVEKEVIKG